MTLLRPTGHSTAHSIARAPRAGKDLLTIQFIENFNEFPMSGSAEPGPHCRLNHAEHLT
jgi:hypothetical protein